MAGKCIIVFDAIKRAASKGNAGLEPIKGAEESFRIDCEICDVLRKWLRDMEEGKKLVEDLENFDKFKFEKMKDWQKVVQETGAPERLDFDEKDPVPAELEGGGSSWWYVCGDCHGAIGLNDHYCKHCGRKVSWE